MYALVIVLALAGGGAYVDGGITFKTAAQCEEARAAKAEVFKAQVAEYNHDADNQPKVTHYGSACVQIEKAPQGKEV